MIPRWLIAIVLAAVIGSIAYASTGSSEVAYVVRSITRHVAGSGW